MIQDLRGSIPLPTKYGIPQPRKWSTIHGVTIHQTGCLMGEDIKTWSGLNAHIGITRGGQIFILQPLDRWIWHAQGLSGFTIGIEIEATAEGIPGYPKPDAHWFYGANGAPTTLTQEQIEGAEELFTFLQDEFAKNGQPWTGVWTHRQSCNQRTCDCGYEIWQKIAMVWRERLGCDPMQIEQTFGCGGQPVPREWDEKAKTRFWG